MEILDRLKVRDQMRLRAVLSTVAAAVLGVVGCRQAWGQTEVSRDGTPSYTYPLVLPPAIAAMAPKISLAYLGGGSNGTVGTGWSVVGIPSISRCPASTVVDGAGGRVKYAESDKLCMNGQRLIQTDSSGAVVPFPQVADADSVATGAREYRPETDGTARVRAYGNLGSTFSDSTVKGPKYFRVWTASGHVYEYGFPVPINATAIALNHARDPNGKLAELAWPLARITDRDGNYVEFDYKQTTRAWGAPIGTYGYLGGNEWTLAGIRYGDNSALARGTDISVKFVYQDRPEGLGDRFDWVRRTQTSWIQSVGIARLSQVETYIERETIPVRTTKLVYANSPTTGRSLLQTVTECAGADKTRCAPPTRFTYSPGGMAYVSSTAFTLDANGTPNGLDQLTLSNSAVEYGIITGDFNGDGRTDILRWSDSPHENKLFLSVGTTGYRAVAAGSGTGQFNVTDQNLFKSDPISKRSDLCFMSMAADFDGDGMTDLLRFASPGDVDADNGQLCPAGLLSYLYKSNGDGSFTRSVVRDAANGNPVLLGRTPGGSLAAVFRLHYANFGVADLDGDGRLDIVATNVKNGYVLPGAADGDAGSRQGIYCTSTSSVCDAVVWLGSGDGSFVKQTSPFFGPVTIASAYKNLWPLTGYWAPFADPRRSSFRFEDSEGKGTLDLVAPSFSLPYVEGPMAGQVVTTPDKAFAGGRVGGAYGFSALGAKNLYSPACTSVFGDFNGDGVGDSLCVVTSQLTRLYYGDFQLSAVGGLPISPATHTKVLDIDGDGRSDIVILGEAAANSAYRSLGDGKFANITSHSNLGGVRLLSRNDAGRYQSDIVMGNFTGQSPTEILLGGRTPNELYVKSVALPPDLLTKVMSPTGTATDITYEVLTASVRYAVDRGTANAAALPKMDLVPGIPVVTKLTVDSGIGAAKQVTEFGYAGAKLEVGGRGYLGFREMRQQNDAPDGVSKITTVKKLLQQHPYIGYAAVSETYLGALSAMNAPQTGQLISRVENTYCDNYAAAGAQASATVAAPCPVTAKLQRPYLYKSVQTAFDLNGSARPTVTTTNTYTGFYPTVVEVNTLGTGLAGLQSVTKRVDNEYWPDDIAGDNWKLGRLKKSTVTSTVPNSLAGIPTASGIELKATATSGQ